MIFRSLRSEFLKGDTCVVDKELILRKLAELDEYLEQIKEFQGIGLQEYASDWKAQRIVERTLQIMIETCVDVAGHIIADKGFRIPNTYSDVFKVMGEEQILEPGLLSNMMKMAKFRNIVVHQYDKIDAEIVIGILKRNLTDFVAFKQSILNFLKKEEQD